VGKNKQLSINMFANLINLIASLAISFFLTPIIIEKLGSESYGFVTLSNNFVNYISLITVALNSVSGRFITIKIHQDDYKSANVYYNSVLIANIVLTCILLIPSIIFIYNLEHVLNITSSLVFEVKILFALVFLSFFISIIGNVYYVATFAKNRLELAAIRNTILNVLRAVSLIAIFTIFKPSIIWIGLTSLIVSILTVIINYSFSKKLLPELKLNIKGFRLYAVKELLSSGCWNTVSQLGQTLLNGLDLLLTNLFVSPALMGVLAVSKTVPDVLGSIAGTLVSAFSPSYTILYAQGKKEELLKEIKQSIKIVGLIFGIPLGGWITLGFEFFSLWVPTEDTTLLYKLSLITTMGLFINGGVSCIYNIFSVTNKLKVNSISLIISGLLNSLIVLILLKTTDLGIYAVAGVSVIILILRNLFISIPYAAKVCLGQKWYFFYGDVLKTIVTTLVVCLIGFIIKQIIPVTSWITLVLVAFLITIISLIIEFFFILNKKEKKIIIQLLNKYLNIKRIINK